MSTFFTYGTNRFAVKLAGLSFLIGNLLFLMQLFSHSEIIMGIGIVFLLLCTPVNTIMLFILLNNLLFYSKDLQQHMTAIVILLLNIPVAGTYIYLLFNI